MWQGLRVVVAVAALASAPVARAAAAGEERPEATQAARPSIVVVVADTLRADRLGCYGSAAGLTPHIDAFAARSLVFERAYAHAADTRFSYASLLTGFLPHETRILERTGIPPAALTLPEILRDHGYRTAAVIGNYVLRRGRGFEQGFETYDDTMEDQEPVRRVPERRAHRTTERAIELLDSLRAGGPFLLWLHYQDAHGPYTPPPEFLRDGPVGRELPLNESISGRGGIPRYQQLGELRDAASYVRRYEGEIRYLDAELGRFLEALERRGPGDELLVVFTADHGEGLGEHDYYFAHGEYLYEHQIRVPLIVRWGERFVGRRPEAVGHVDVLPTILQLLDIDPDPRLRGRAVLSASLGSEGIVSVMKSFVRDGRKASLVHGDYKYIYTQRGSLGELYDLRADPGEQRDLSADPAHAARLERLHGELAGVLAVDRAGLPAPSARKPGAQEQELLRSLGYVE